MKTKFFASPTPYIAVTTLLACYLLFEAMFKCM